MARDPAFVLEETLEPQRAGAIRLTGLCDRAGLSAGCLRRPRRPAAFLARLGGAAHSEAWHGTQAASFLAAVGAGPPGYRRGRGTGETRHRGRAEAGGEGRRVTMRTGWASDAEALAKGHLNRGPGCLHSGRKLRGRLKLGWKRRKGGGRGRGEAGKLCRACGAWKGRAQGASWRSGGSRAHFEVRRGGKCPKGSWCPSSGLPGA